MGMFTRSDDISTDSPKPVSGGEQMLMSLMSKFGIDPKLITDGVSNFQQLSKEIAERQTRIESKLDRILTILEPTPVGGYVIGDGSPDSLSVEGLESAHVEQAPS